MKVKDLPLLQSAKKSIKKAGFSEKDFSIWCGLNKFYIKDIGNYDARTNKQKKNNENVERGRDLPGYINFIADAAADFHFKSGGRLHILTVSEPQKMTYEEFEKEQELVDCTKDQLVNLGWRQRKGVPKWGARFIEMKKLLMLDRKYDEYEPKTLHENLKVAGLSLNRFSELVKYSYSNLQTRPILPHIFNLSALMRRIFIKTYGEVDFEKIIWEEKVKYLKDKDNKDKLKFTDEDLQKLLGELGFDEESFSESCGSSVRHINWRGKPGTWAISYLRLLKYERQLG